MYVRTYHDMYVVCITSSYISMCVRVRACVYECMSVIIYVHTYGPYYVCGFVLQVCMCVRVCVFMCVCTCVRACVHV